MRPVTTTPTSATRLSVPFRNRSCGATLVELMVVLSIVAIVIGGAIPKTAAILHEAGVKGAAHYYRGLIRKVRRQAISQNRYLGIVFEEKEGDVMFSIVADGNGNGIRSAEIRSGVDPLIHPKWHNQSRFTGVQYGSDGRPDAFPPLRFGRSKILSFSPTGSSSTGTLFLGNRTGNLYAVIVYGATGRVRVARYRDGKWESV